MSYLLDTSVCIHLIRQRPAALLERLAAQEVGQVGVSAITVAELQYGVHRSRAPERNAEALAQFLIPLVVLDFDEAAAAAYGPLRAYLEASGATIRSMDMLIAAHALSIPATLVTYNLREFERVPGLRVEAWGEA